MKKKIVALMLLSCMALTACGNTMSPSEAAANGQAPVANTGDTAGETESAENADANETSEESPEVVLNADPSKAATDAPVSLDTVAIKAGSVTIKIDEDFLPNVDAVGEATIEEGQACLDGGFDTNYYYGGEELVVYTVASSGQQLIYDIYVTGSQYETVAGAKVGTSTRADVETIYGAPTSTVGNSNVYEITGTTIQAQFEFDANDVLTSIDVLKK